jgi:hypothetical protein
LRLLRREANAASPWWKEWLSMGQSLHWDQEESKIRFDMYSIKGKRLDDVVSTKHQIMIWPKPKEHFLDYNVTNRLVRLIRAANTRA